MAELINNCLECCLCSEEDTECISAMRVYVARGICGIEYFGDKEGRFSE